MKTLIKNGTIHLEAQKASADVLVVDGLIAEIGNIDCLIDDCSVIDAAGLHVLPGLIDIHTHLDDNIGGYKLADTWTTGSEIAVLNGITTLCGFITQRQGSSLQEAVESALVRAEGKSYSDYSFHLTPVSFGKPDWAYIERLRAGGFRTFKFYTTYREAGIFTGYDELRSSMERIRDMGAAVLVHCEDDGTIQRAKGNTTDRSNPYGHALSRPMEAEAEAIRRVLEVVGKTKCPCHIVHISTVEGAKLARQAGRGLPVTCETCPQYLFLSDGKLREKNGHRFICSPPLRSEENRAEMERLASGGAFDVYATDHCAFSKKDKDGCQADFTRVPSGLPGIGALMPLTYGLHMDFGTLATRLALNPAKAAGLYPRKGAIRKGSDADLALISAAGPERPVRSSLSDTYEIYAEKRSRVLARHVFLRGELIVRDGTLVNRSRHAGKRV